MSLPCWGSSIMLPTLVTPRKTGSKVDLARSHRIYTHSGAFLCCSRRCYLVSWGWEQGYMFLRKRYQIIKSGLPVL
uniref:Uncharacterized protein n=1 Tax=Theropithecus gelada TaxID=9565 RepID=A0A8D2EDY4_THEGE